MSRLERALREAASLDARAAVQSEKVLQAWQRPGGLGPPEEQSQEREA